MSFHKYLFCWLYLKLKKMKCGYSDPEDSAVSLIQIFLGFNVITFILLLNQITDLSEYLTLKKERDLIVIAAAYFLSAILLYRYYVFNDRFRGLLEDYHFDKSKDILAYIYFTGSIIRLFMKVVGKLFERLDFAVKNRHIHYPQDNLPTDIIKSQ